MRIDKYLYNKKNIELPIIRVDKARDLVRN